MRVVPERPPWAQLAAVLLGFTMGPLLGLGLGMVVTPGSDLVQAVGVFAFGLVFLLGILSWAGFGIIAVVVSGLGKLLHGERPRPAELGPRDRLVPPGYRSFPVVGAVVGLGMGLLAGVATELTVGQGSVMWGAAGLAYGGFLWAAAHHGYLPFPEGD